MQSYNGLYILKEGEVVREGDVIKYASSSVVLILLHANFAILVDTALKENLTLIEEKIKSIGLQKDDIKAIINTHLHRDHTGCNEAFSCDKYAHPLEIERMKAKSKSFDEYSSYEYFPQNEKIEIIETPGHCYGHISVVYKGKCEPSVRSEASETIVIAGDAIPRRGNFVQKTPPRIHVDRKKAIESIKRIESIADVIIPGHDLPIMVKRT